ncbi:beta-1,6-N-acetylglucosaminyltransferase [Methylorubrum extorquens]
MAARTGMPMPDGIMTVYFITCHHSVAFVRDQFRFLYHPDHFYLYHVDAKAPEALHETVRRLARAFPNVEFLPSRHYAWAGYSQVRTTLDAIAWALTFASSWSHFVTLSEQHCPLRAPAEMGAELSSETSYLAAMPFAAMDPGGQADLVHRSSMDFRELPGVGSFGIDAIPPDPGFLARLHHGSNWYILSRQACVYLCEIVPSTPDVARFRQSVHADEDMIPTLLVQADGQAGLLDLRETTFVAWPHIIGNDSMIFRENDFFAASQDGSLFIRKRPPILPDPVAATLEQFAAFTEADLTAAIGEAPAAAPPIPDREGTSLARRVAGAVVRRGVGVRADLLNLRYRRRDPLFSLVFQTDGMPRDVEVRVLSQNLSDFRVLLLSMAPPAIDFVPLQVHGRMAHMLRVRSDDLFGYREIRVPEDPAHGFWTRASDSNVIGLVRRIEFYIGVAESLATGKAPRVARGTFAIAALEVAAFWRSARWTGRRLLRQRSRA